MSYYFDYGSTSLKKPEKVAEKIYDILSSGDYANPSRGSYREANNAFLELYRSRKEIAEFFGLTDERYLIFTGNSTEALNIAIKGVLREGDHVITTKMEHNSVLRPIYQISSEKNISYTVVNSDNDGIVLYDEIEKSIRKNTRLLAVSHSSNVTGNITDIGRISKICRKHGILLLVDGSQTAGVIDTDIKKEGIDLYCFTGHKSLFGPQGVGGLCIVNRNIEIARYNVGGSGIKTFDREQPEEYPGRLEAGTYNTPGIAGLAEGIRYIREQGIGNLYRKQKFFAEKFYNGIKDIGCLEFYGNFEKPKTAVVSFNFRGIPSGDISEVLSEEYDIAIRAGTHCAPLMHEHFGTREQGMVRFSFSSMNTEEEIDYAVEAVKKIAKNI